MTNRRKVRLRVIQSLYACEMSGNSVEHVLKDDLLKDSFSGSIKKFYVDLMKKTAENNKRFDELIENKSKNWEFARIAIMDKIILRLAICEFLYFPDIPPKVTIDEAIEISKKFSTEKSSSFINGILDSILMDLRKEGKIKKRGRGLQNKKDLEEKQK